MRRALVSFGLLLLLAASAGAAPAASPVTYRAQIDAIAGDQTWVEVTRSSAGVSPAEWKSFSLTVADAEDKADLKQLKKGDLVWITADGKALREIEIQKVAVSFLMRLVTVLVVMLALGALTWLLLGRGQPLSRFIVGRDNRYSKSKFQIAMWFATVLIVYLATFYLRWWASVPSLVGGIDIPQNLLLLSGISALSFATAKGITQRKENNPATAPKQAAAAPRFASDLVSDDSGQPDLGDFQMVMIVIIAVGVYIVQAFSFLSLLEMRSLVSLPDVDPTLLGIFGISHGAYLTKKAVSGDDGAGGGGQQQAQPQGGQPQAAAQPPQAGQPGPV